MSQSRRIRRDSFDDGSLSTYLREIRAYPLLSREDEAELTRRARAGEVGALEQLVCANLRFVVSVAKRYQNRGVPLSDLIDEGNLGLLRAAERFDESKGIKFISYAVWWIRQSIVQALAEGAHAVRVPLNRASMVQRIGRHANGLRHELGREPTQRELADELQISEEEIENTLPIARAYLSLDAPVGDGDDANLLDVLADSVGSDDEAIDSDVTASLHEAIGSLREREAGVLRRYYGLDGLEPSTLEDIAGSLGITRERVRQIKEKALGRLRKLPQVSGLDSLHGA